MLDSFPRLVSLPVHFHFLAYPLFYIYIQKVSIFNTRKLAYWTLVPGFIEVLAGLVIFMLPVETRLLLKHSEYAVLYFFLGLLYTIYISIFIIIRIRAHQQEVDNQFSQTDLKRLEWPLYFIYASIGFHLLLLRNFYYSNTTFYLVITLINVILIYWVSYKGITQDNVISLYILPEQKDENVLFGGSVTESHLEHDKSGFMNDAEMHDVVSIVDAYVAKSQCFTREALTIIDLAEATNIHPKRISHSLNKLRGMNFNNYINRFRVEKAKAILMNEGSQHFSVEGIGIEAGFHSKATFYGAFKKFEGCTPASYKKELV